MPAPKPPAFETLSLHAGQHPDPVTGARAVPIYQTTSYVFQDSEHAAALFNLERTGHIYTRISNPTTAVLEERLAALEGGVGAICTASGMAAMHLAIATLLNAGDHIVASSSLYGGSINLLTHTLPRFGITTTFVKPRALEEFRSAIRPNTRMVIGETIGNPGLEVLDIPKVAQIAHEAKIPLLIDNTFATPYLSRPIELGADIVMNSTTKWIGGVIRRKLRLRTERTRDGYVIRAEERSRLPLLLERYGLPGPRGRHTRQSTRTATPRSDTAVPRPLQDSGDRHWRAARLHGSGRRSRSVPPRG